MAYLELADLRCCLADLGQAAPSPAPVANTQGRVEAQDLIAMLSLLKATAAQAKLSMASLTPVLRQKRANLASLKRDLAAAMGATGLGDGASQFVMGQLAKIDADVRSGRWTDMLVELVRITPSATGSEVQDWLSDPLFSDLKNNLGQNYNPSDPQLLNIAQTALNALAANPPIQWDGRTPPDPPPLLPAPGDQDNKALLASAMHAQFDPAVYNANNQGFSQYVAAHKPQGGGVLTTVLKVASLPTQALNQIPGYKQLAANLNKYVPGWQIALNLLVPGGSLLGFASSMLGTAGNIPLIGGVIQTAGGLVSAGYGAASNISIVGPAVQDVVYLADKLPFSVSAVADTYLKTDGSMSNKLLAAGLESISEFALAAQACAMILSFGSFAAADAAIASAISSAAASMKSTVIAAQSGNPYDIAAAAAQAASSLAAAGGVVSTAMAATNTATSVVANGGSDTAGLILDATKYILIATKTGISVAKAYTSALKIKAAADMAKRQAMVEAAKIDAQTQEITNQIAQIRAEEARIQAQRARAAAAGKTPLVSPIAQALGVSESTVVYGGIAAVLIVIGAVVVMSDDED